jgi:hypothetical protein
MIVHDSVCLIVYMLDDSLLVALQLHAPIKTSGKRGDILQCFQRTYRVACY